MSATRCIFKSKVFESDIVVAPPPDEGTEGKICLIKHHYEEKRFWHDDIDNYTSDGAISTFARGNWLPREVLSTEELMPGFLLNLTIPLHEHPTIIQKVIEVAESKPGQPIPIVAIVLNIRVCSLGTVDYQDIIDSVAREPVNINLAPNEVMPLERTHQRREFSETEVNRLLNPTPTTRSFIEGLIKGLKKLKLDSLEEDVIRENPTCAICIRDL